VNTNDYLSISIKMNRRPRRSTKKATAQPVRIERPASTEENSEKISWLSHPRTYLLETVENKGRYVRKSFITDRYEEVDRVPRLSLELLPHQKITVKAMVEVETKQICKLDGSLFRTHGYLKPIIETRAAVLSEHPGSGKTIEVLASIALNPLPPKRPEITTLPFPRHYQVGGRSHLREEGFQNMGFAMEVRKTYQRTFRQSLIFVGKSVLIQWMETIQEYTDFEVFMIDNIFALREFYNMCFGKAEERKKLDKYDIILVKNGNISGKFEVKRLIGTPLEKTKARAIISLFGEIFCDCFWAKVYLDDYDYLNIPTTAKVIPAGFTWFVSATKRQPPLKRHVDLAVSMEDILVNARPYYVSMWMNRELFTFFNLGCVDYLIEESTRASKVNYYVYRYENPNDTYINLVGVMGTTETNNIMEMLNGDAIKTAAQATGIETTSAADIFERLLDTRWQIYKKAMAVSKYIPSVRKYVNTLPALSDPKLAISGAGLTKLKRNLRKPGPLSRAKSLVSYKQVAVLTTLSEVEEENNQIKEENGKALDRVKDNLRQGECPITCESLSEVPNIIIMKCCNVIISAEAVSWALKMHSNNNNIEGVCPNCRRNITIQSLIFIDRETVELEKIIKDDVFDDESDDEDLEEGVTEPAVEPAVEPEVEVEPDELVEPSDLDEASEPIEMKKYQCIIKIIKGVEIEERESREDIRIPNLLEGEHDLGDPPEGRSKVIIFANFKETMKIIETRLVRHEIPYLKLQGSALHIKDAVTRFNLPNEDDEAINVLLVNGPRFVAGLNLQVATDLIFTGKIMDPNIESQIAGRVCRVGRKYNVRIHYVLYPNEYSYMFGGERSVRQ
jgi:SNF2 family DNA or RNA helicase